MTYRLVLGEGGKYFQSSVCYAQLDEFAKKDSWPACDRFNIAQTCRAANEEANEIIYRNNTFRFDLSLEYWPNPRITQKTADIMQNIHIGLGSDEASMTRSVHILQMFTSSQVVREECRIRIYGEHFVDFNSKSPILQVLKGLTAFKVVIVWLAGLYGFCNDEECDYAMSLWGHMGKELEAVMGKAVFTDNDDSNPYLKFKPQDYLVQKDLSP